MKKAILFFLFISFISIKSNAQTINGSFMHDGVQRDYSLYIPVNYSASNAAPLVLNFHGFGHNGVAHENSFSKFKAIADTAGFIVVAPTGTPLPILNLNHWNVGGWTNSSPVDDIGFASALIDTIATNYNINMARVYSTGFSNGGFFSHRLACELGYRIAAIASVAGTFTPEIQSNCTPSHPTPVLQIHGTTDPTVPYNGTTGNGGMAPVDSVIDYWVNYNNCNSTPTVTALPDVNTTDGSTVERIVYSGGDAGVTVEHLKVTGGAHNWPGSTGNMDITASLEIWKFFSKYSNTNVSTNSIIKSQFKIYPNPVLENLTIENSSNKKEVYAVYNLVGNKVLEGQLSTGSNSISFSSLSNGIYVLRTSGKSFKIEKR